MFKKKYERMTVDELKKGRPEHVRHIRERKEVDFVKQVSVSEV